MLAVNCRAVLILARQYAQRLIDRAGMRTSFAARPDDLAGPILRALGHRSTVVPGALSKLLTSALSTLPRSARVRVMGNIMKGMVNADARATGQGTPAG